MNSGCICCSLVGDFETSLKQVMEQYAPERILIEPSGVGKLSDVMRAIQNIAEGSSDMELNSAVTVVDATKAKVYIKNFGEFFINQIENAGTIILTRTDKADQAKIETAVELIREHNKKATIITTPLADITGKEILDTFEDMVSYASEHGVKVIIIAGDMFDKPNVHKQAKNRVIEQFREHPEIDFCYLRGNHDKCNFTDDITGDNSRNLINK
jgi:G3E family GTPase